jgi:uncharacterized protein with HEPN domain
MKHPERVADYLEHIAEAIERATGYIDPFQTLEALLRDHKTQDAIVRNIEIIGEAAGNIQKMDPDFVANHPELPWVEMRGMRNKMIHNYFDVDWEVVWSTVKDDLSRLKQQIDALLLEQRHGHRQD